MLTYFGIGATVAATRLIFDWFGWYQYKKDEFPFILSLMLIDLCMWPLTLAGASMRVCSTVLVALFGP